MKTRVLLSHLTQLVQSLGGAVVGNNELLHKFLGSDITRLLRQRWCLCALEACSGVIVGVIFSSSGLRTPNRRGPEYQEEEEEEGGIVSHGGRLKQ